jgi:hypothetical protein
VKHRCLFLSSIHGVGARNAAKQMVQGGAVPPVETQPPSQTKRVQKPIISGAQQAVQQAAPAIGPLKLR